MRMQVVEIPKVSVGETSDRGCLLVLDQVKDIEQFAGQDFSAFKQEAGISGVLITDESVEVVR